MQSPAFWESDPKYFSQFQGLINVTSNSADGERGPPVFFSPPHFCGSDPVLREHVIGLECNDAKRDFYIDVEPYTGTLPSFKSLQSFGVQASH